MILKYIVNKNDTNKTINEIINQKVDLSNRLFSRLIKNKNIFVNDKNIDTRLKVTENDVITIDLNYEEDNSNIVSKQMNLDIVYEDESLLIINKPSGIAIHPSIRHYEDSIASGVKYYFESIGIHKKIRPVNRLDLNTSGLVIFAKNEYIQENLIKQMQTKTFTKEYLAIVTGVLENKKGIIDKPIARKEGSIIERCVCETGQRAITEYEVIKEVDNSSKIISEVVNNYDTKSEDGNNGEIKRDTEKYSLVKCKLLTGRTHQIRVHFAYIGHPLLGDSLYGKKSDLIEGQALHCYILKFLHPVTTKELVIKCDLSNKLNSILTNL